MRGAEIHGNTRRDSTTRIPSIYGVKQPRDSISAIRFTDKISLVALNREFWQRVFLRTGRFGKAIGILVYFQGSLFIDIYGQIRGLSDRLLQRKASTSAWAKNIFLNLILDARKLCFYTLN